MVADDQAHKNAAVNLIDFELDSNPAVVLYAVYGVRRCRDCAQFEEMMRRGCSEAPVTDILSSVANFMETELDPDASVTS